MSYNRNCKWFSMEYVGNPGAVPACNQKGILEVFDCTSCQENPNNKKMLDLDEYNAVFSCDLSKEAFDVIMGNPLKIQDANELIFVDPDTHEKIVFKRVPKRGE